MGDIAVGEAFTDKVYIRDPTTHNPVLLLTPVCTIIDESGNRAVGIVAEEGSGWYTCTFTPDAAGIWATEWADPAGNQIWVPTKLFKVGGGDIATVLTRANTIIATMALDATVAKEATLTTTNGYLTHVTYGLSALKTLIDTTNAYVDEVESLLKNAAYGLNALHTEHSAISAAIAALNDLSLADIEGSVVLAKEATSTAIQVAIAALNDISIADIEASSIAKTADVTAAHAATDALINALNDLSLADIEGSTVLAKEVTLNTKASQASVDAVAAAIAALNDLSLADIEGSVVLAKTSDITTAHSTTNGKVDAIQTDLGDFSSQVNLQSLLAALGIPDVSGKSLYTCLITDRLDNATYGLSALKILIDATNAYVDEIESLLKDGTYGLSALETLIDEVETLLKDGTYGLSALKTLIDALALEATLTAIKGGGWSTETLKAIYDIIVSSHATTDGLINALNDLAQSDILSDATPFAGADIAGIKAKTDNLPDDPADASDIAADFDRHLTYVDFWSATDDVIPITAAADQDYDLPDVTVPALPSGATIWKVYLIFKCALIRDTSGADNGIDEAGLIRIKKDGDADFDADGVTAYNIVDNMWLVDVTNVGRDRGGDAFVGNIDISAKVTGADTYNIRLDSISADGANLELHDVCVGLRIYFY